MTKRIVADDIMRLLANKHSDDVFVPECKDGPTHGGRHQRIDGWAMKRSWAHPLVIGYEVKVSRSDFLQDNKWPAYLPMCNQLYFVCPTGLIQPTELPAEVGLMWVSKTGTRLYTKTKAAHRDVEIPENVWRYILMCRVSITRENVRRSDRDFWADWLKHKRLDTELGWRVSRSLRQRIHEEIDKANNENKRLKELIAEYDDIRKLLEELEINPDSRWYASTWAVRQKIEKARRLLPDGLLNSLQSVARAAEIAHKSLEKLETEGAESND